MLFPLYFFLFLFPYLDLLKYFYYLSGNAGECRSITL